jgi:hypothetical protein
MGDLVFDRCEVLRNLCRRTERISSMLTMSAFLLQCENDGRRTAQREFHSPHRICDESRPKCVGRALAGLSQLLYRSAGRPLQVGLSAVRILPQLLRLLLKPLQANHHSRSGFTNRMLIWSALRLSPLTYRADYN